MYLRFYAQTEDNIRKCIAELIPIFPVIKDIQKRPITKSVNFKLPEETDILKNIEMDLTFETKDDELQARNSKAGFEIYKKYMSGIQGAQAVVRNPGDSAINHR